MNLDQTQFLKWIPAAEAIRLGVSYIGFNECLIYAKEGARIQGFAFFPLESLNSSTVERLEKRFVGNKSDLHFILPPSAEGTWSKLRSSSRLPKIDVRLSGCIRVLVEGGSLQVRDRLTLVNVDDSPVILKMLKQVLSSSSGVEILAQISDPLKAAQEIKRLRPDALTMDIQMPGKNGIQLVQELQSVYPLPIIMVSSLGLEEGSMVYQALEAGAFDYVQKPELSEVSGFRQELLQKIELAVKGFSTQSLLRRTRSAPTRKTMVSPGGFQRGLVWCLGASTGGTQALTRVMTGLPEAIPPTLIVQHIPPIFSKSFAESLNNVCPFEVVEASDGQELRSNTVYIAPGGFQMALEEKTAGALYLRVSDAAPVNRFKPSVDFLFYSVAKIEGAAVVAGILTGMGKDGADGLLRLRQSGAVTFAQDESSSVVYGMPRAAKENGGAKEILSLDQVADFLIESSRQSRKSA